jgi:ATP-binding cassette subfamily B protein
LLIGLQVIIALPIQKKQLRRQEATAEMTAIVNDSLQNTSTVAAYALENVMLQRCEKAFANFIKATLSYLRAFVPLVMLGILASIAPLLVVTALAAARVINGHMTLVEMIAFLMLAFEAGGWLTMLGQRQNDIQTGAAGAQRLMEAMDGEAEDLTKGDSLRPHDGAVLSAKNLTFAYPGSENNALDDVNFHIEKGARVAFVGGSGSGKSTVLKLLLGLYSPQAGALHIMGADTGDLSLEALRAAYAYVPQDSFLFPASIGANITGETTITDMPRLEKACKDAGIYDFIQTLPQKYNAVLNESAENISGGQKQRIALARAFYRDAPIILFDEATSALDPTTETAVLQSLETLSADKTVVMVSHRIKPIAFCDTIIVMDGGKVAGVGSHQTLMETCHIYKNLYDAQNNTQDNSHAGRPASARPLANETEEVQA